MTMRTLCFTILFTIVLTSERPEDSLVYLNVDSLSGRQFDIVWAMGSEVARGDVSVSFNQDSSENRTFSMSGQCDYQGSYSTGPDSDMDLNMKGTYNECTNSSVKDSIDHWNNNRVVNNAKMNILYCSAFGSSWVTFGDKNQSSNEMTLMVGQHLLSHPKFLNEHYQNQMNSQKKKPSK